MPAPYKYVIIDSCLGTVEVTNDSELVEDRIELGGGEVVVYDTENSVMVEYHQWRGKKITPAIEAMPSHDN